MSDSGKERTFLPLKSTYLFKISTYSREYAVSDAAAVTAHRLRRPPSLHREEKYRGKRYCWEVYQILVYFEPFHLTVLNLSDCALLKSLTVVTERDAQFECWTEDDRQTDAAEREVHVDLNLTT